MKLIDNVIIPYVFNISEIPMRFKELLNANKVFHEGMNLENNVHGFRLRLGRTYLVFFMMWSVVFVALSWILHFILVKIDFHVLIILTAIVTGLFFVGFSMFREFLIERAVKKLIEKAWKRHFALFDFKEQSKNVAQFYGEALEQEIPIGDLQRFIFDKLAQVK